MSGKTSQIKPKSFFFKKRGRYKIYKPGLSPQQRTFARIVSETGDLKKAAAQAYGASASTALEDKGRAVVAKPAVRKEILRIWAEAGLTLEKASARHEEIMMNPKSSETAVLKAVDMVYEGHGVYERKEEKTPSNVLALFIDQRRERGLPIPAQVLEAERVLKDDGAQG